MTKKAREGKGGGKKKKEKLLLVSKMNLMISTDENEIGQHCIKCPQPRAHDWVTLDLPPPSPLSPQCWPCEPQETRGAFQSWHNTPLKKRCLFYICHTVKWPWFPNPGH